MRSYFDEQGQPEGIFCIACNITLQVKTKSRIDDANSEISVNNDKLSEISFMQSHVIRKPLANIMGLANLLVEMDLNTHQKSIIDKMTASADELDTVIENISDTAD
ncbi:histidine kinase dimerization/phospho-acceptor domain-containing protein [Mucilaginibacter sp. UR6-1]|uniref:histidine kinase dimerization/phospho-acceptor domain-containing protein n=1 Tax=Mucilaginibacter sp. UR6-1 TaxID=1435643 RepID=UPI001E64BB0E|nr:histidine kinase dimerization/phospho-acceptor domain-containing protein [Mucilaginibacter sp. UR6-1]